MSQIEDAELPLGLMASILAHTGRGCLLLRHSDREIISVGEVGPDARLTDRGERRALALAKALQSPIGWALSSPLHRCVRTATLISQTSPEISKLLGAPGAFVVDEDLGGQVFAENGAEMVVRTHISGRTWGCLRSVEEGARLLLGEIGERTMASTALGLAVSHDAIVMPVISWLTGHRFASDWLDPLDGVMIGEGVAYWRGERFGFC